MGAVRSSREEGRLCRPLGTGGLAAPLQAGSSHGAQGNMRSQRVDMVYMRRLWCFAEGDREGDGWRSRSAGCCGACDTPPS